MHAVVQVAQLFASVLTVLTPIILMAILVVVDIEDRRTRRRLAYLETVVRGLTQLIEEHSDTALHIEEIERENGERAVKIRVLPKSPVSALPASSSVH